MLAGFFIIFLRHVLKLHNQKQFWAQNWPQGHKTVWQTVLFHWKYIVQPGHQHIHTGWATGLIKKQLWWLYLFLEQVSKPNFLTSNETESATEADNSHKNKAELRVMNNCFTSTSMPLSFWPVTSWEEREQLQSPKNYAETQGILNRNLKISPWN